MLRSSKFAWATCLSAFTLILFSFLYTSTPSMDIQLKLKISPSMTIAERSNEPAVKEKFITYLPHSGLHNQRIGLINAILLAKVLNRTLILPEINLGKGIYWKQTPFLEERLSECTSAHPSKNVSCNDFKKYVPVSVETIFDLTAAHNAGVRTIQRSNMSSSYFSDVLSLTDEEIYRVEDDARQSYRIYDSKDNLDSLHSFSRRLEMEDLCNRDETVIVFGSLHYTLRLALSDPYLVWLAEHLRQATSFSHPIVIEQALHIISLMNGPGSFVGVHLRQGDGFFKDLQEETLNNLRNTLEQPNLDNEQLQKQLVQPQQEPWVIRPATPLTADDEWKLQQLQMINEKNPVNKMDLLNQCIVWHEVSSHPRLRLIYMATDTPQPRTTLKELFEEFPCIFTLSDFPDVIESTLTMAPLLSGNDSVDNEAIQKSSLIAPSLIPMIDAEVASHGANFVGTRKSTFSQYIKYRFNRYQSLYYSH
ncbi:hypothetical protein BDF20DRAFT_905287 [Mycotypha africana]|uniref:uncharacterized protein n=1 Tax=Mycotypha africana TaxID=64632 RepID=UPI0023000B5B|nr:uncharacterized protein BDF20DRAFT_905287 [Mycotypha africana]KAI8984305.1 hypothetical protein BDF20DRAFT_905287 [Mycotypha africana]